VHHPGTQGLHGERSGNQKVEAMNSGNWLDELEVLEQYLAIHFADIRGSVGWEQLEALRALLDTIADLRALVYTRIGELETILGVWSQAEDT
jgi:hypothetical protein